MRKFVIGGILSVVLMALPQIASAHTGSVSCTDKGVVFFYNNNFEGNTTVTEFVKDSTQGNGNYYYATVPARTATTHIVPAPSVSVIASAAWKGGSIGPVTLNCPPSPPVCPANTTQEGVSNGVLVCVRTVTTPAPPPTVVTVVKLVPVENKAPKCPKGTKRYNSYGSMVVCTKRHVVVKHVVRLIPYKPVVAPKKPHVGGVAG